MTTSLVVIVGATGTGKTDLSLDLAEALAERGRSAEIVNADAMQLYRGMDIGTAKVPPTERRGVPHHLLDVLDPVEDASVARYQTDARAAVRGIQERGAIPILVGGSGLYVSSVIHDYEFPGTDPEVRARLESELEALGAAALHARLAAVAPDVAERIDPRNGRRTVRALEAIEVTGGFAPGSPEGAPRLAATVVALDAARETLGPRLDARVERMWSAGIVEEAAALRERGIGGTASRAIGYAQALAQLDGDLSRADAVAETQRLTRRYARRQVSWFRRYREARWIGCDEAGRLEFALAAAAGED